MEKISGSSSATIDTAIMDQLLKETERIALEQAAREEKKVSDIQGLQREALEEILSPAGSSGDSSFSDQIIAQAEQKIAEEHAVRMNAVEAAPDAYVFERTDAAVGLQHDDDRRIGIADEALEDAALTERIAKHEAEHRLQETGDSSASIPKTGDEVVDSTGGTIDRLTFREAAAVEAEGGLADHTEEYHTYVETAEHVAAYLDEAGIEGTAAVEEAGRTNEGFEKLQEELTVAAIQKELRERSSALTAA